MEKDLGTYLVAIVALVAVVGLVLMFTGQSTSDSAYIVDEEGNIVGEAFRFNNYWKPLEKLEAEPTDEELRILAEAQTADAGFGIESASGCEEGETMCGSDCCTAQEQCDNIGGRQFCTFAG